MNNLKGKRIFIFQQRLWGTNFGYFLAKKLQAAGCLLGALTSTKRTHDFFISQAEVKHEIIVSFDEILGNPGKYLAGDDFSLREICQALQIDSVWPIARTVREYIRSYKDKYGYGFKQNVSDETIVLYIKAVYKCLKKVFSEFRPDIIIAPNFVSLHHIMFNLYAKAQGIKMISFFGCKIKGVSLFYYDYLNSEGPFFDRVEELYRGEAESQNIEKARQYISGFRKEFKRLTYAPKIDDKKKSLWQIIKSHLAPWANIARWYWCRPKKAWEVVGVSPDFRPPYFILRDYIASKRYKHFADNFKYYSLDKIKKFVYLPLQVQPEIAIDVAAPFFSNQLEVARLVAMSLPEDYVLVVRDAPAMVGRRTPSYMEKLARTPNVKLVDYRVSTQEVLGRADLVVSFGGTTLAEAAFYSKPGIQVGDFGITLKLPNVFKHTDMTTLASKIKEVLKVNLNNQEYERKLEKYVAANYDAGYEVDFFDVWYGRDKDLAESAWQIYKAEIERLTG